MENEISPIIEMTVQEFLFSKIIFSIEENKNAYTRHSERGTSEESQVQRSQSQFIIHNF